jgi:hypothetical protein
MSGQQHASAVLYPWERPGTYCAGVWVGPRAGLDMCGKSRPTGIWSPDRPACSQSLYRLSYPDHVPHSIPVNYQGPGPIQLNTCWGVSCYETGFSGAARQINRLAATTKHCNTKMSRPQILYCGSVKHMSDNGLKKEKDTHTHTYIHIYHKKGNFLPSTL